jgi:hypothetical protein
VILSLENLIKKWNLYKIINKYLDKNIQNDKDKKFRKLFWSGFVKLFKGFYDQK